MGEKKFFNTFGQSMSHFLNNTDANLSYAATYQTRIYLVKRGIILNRQVMLL